MYIVNTTFVILPSVHGTWLDFFTNKVLPQVKEQGYNVLAFSRVLHEQVEEHYSYSLQVEVDEIGKVQKYKKEIIGEYVEMAKKMYNEQALHFTTVLKVIER